MNLQNATTDYLRTLEKRIKILLTDGQTNRQQITRALSDEEKKYLQRLQREIFLTLRVQSDKSDQVKFASSILKSYTLLGDRIEGDVLFEVKRGIKKELSVDQVAKNIRGRLDVAEHTSKTISRTASGGVGNASRIAQAAEAGLTFFRYGGSQSPERPFCKEHINKVYSLVDIRAMDNDQGLPVEFFGGGYNCRHFWVAVSNEEAAYNKEKNIIFLAKVNPDNVKLKQHEIDTAKALTESGFIVRFNKRTNEEGIKSFDAFINGSPSEFKDLTNDTKNELRRMRDNISNAVKQGAKTIVMRITKKDFNVGSINEGIKKGFVFDSSHEIEAIIIIIGKSITTISRKDWENGKRL